MIKANEMHYFSNFFG